VPGQTHSHGAGEEGGDDEGEDENDGSDELNSLYGDYDVDWLVEGGGEDEVEEEAGTAVESQTGASHSLGTTRLSNPALRGEGSGTSLFLRDLINQDEDGVGNSGPVLEGGEEETGEQPWRGRTYGGSYYRDSAEDKLDVYLATATEVTRFQRCGETLAWREAENKESGGGMGRGRVMRVEVESEEVGDDLTGQWSGTWRQSGAKVSPATSSPSRMMKSTIEVEARGGLAGVERGHSQRSDVPRPRWTRDSVVEEEEKEIGGGVTSRSSPGSASRERSRGSGGSDQAEERDRASPRPSPLLLKLRRARLIAISSLQSTFAPGGGRGFGRVDSSIPFPDATGGRPSGGASALDSTEDRAAIASRPNPNSESGRFPFAAYHVDHVWTCADVGSPLTTVVMLWQSNINYSSCM